MIQSNCKPWSKKRVIDQVFVVGVEICGTKLVL